MKNTLKKLAILITGGTLDKVHDTFTEGLAFAPGGETHMDGLLRIGRCDFPRLVPVMQKDSLEMNDGDRARLLDAVAASPEPAIVITHGTGTMDKTAQYLNGKCGDKTVVLTGAMRPFSLGKSDAGFNVGGAVIAAQTLPAGVYAVMNGRVFTADTLKKDTNRGRFD